MKKIIMLGILGVIFLMVSTATAVPTTQSQPIMDTIEKIEESKSLIESNIVSSGFLTDLIDLIITLIQLGLQIYAIYKNITGLINLVQTLFNNITSLMDMINQFIQFITDLLNPEPLRI